MIDPTIDPVTGLPVLDTSGIVQQIPLGNQIVDYASWNASAQPTRGPLYPDDVIPIFANLQGQHPTTGNAQTINTDGEHRLQLSLGGVPLQATPTTAYNTNGFDALTAGITYAVPTLTKPLYVWAILWWVQLAPPLASSHYATGFTWFIESEPSGTRFGLATGVLSYNNPSTSGDNLSITENIWLPNPINLSSAFPATDTSAKAGIACDGGLNCAMGLVYE